MTLVTLKIRWRSQKPYSFLMMYLCQFGQNLAIDLENRGRQCFFIELYDVGDLENMDEVTKI